MASISHQFRTEYLPRCQPDSEESIVGEFIRSELEAKFVDVFFISHDYWPDEPEGPSMRIVCYTFEGQDRTRGEVDQVNELATAIAECLDIAVDVHVFSGFDTKRFQRAGCETN